MAPTTLFQFELCPFCHKVRAGLEVKGIPYEKVEVNPMTKKELPLGLPDGTRKKVPVIAYAGEVVQDSTDILEWLDGAYDQGPRLVPEDEELARRTREIEAFVDDELVKALPTVIYGTWSEALKAAQVTARTSNFGFFQNVSVRAGGPLIMHQVAKRLLKKSGRTDGHAWVNEALDHFEERLGDQPFIVGDDVSLGDVAMHGAMSCVEDFPIFATMMDRPKLSAWFKRMTAARA